MRSILDSPGRRALVLILLAPLFLLWPSVFGGRTYVPYDLAIFPPVLLAVIQLDSISLVLLVLVSLAVLQFLVGNVIEPMVLGDRLNLSPLVVLLSLIFWGWLWGVVGMLLSVPIMSAVKITLAHTPGYELWAQFMEDPRKTRSPNPTA